MFETFSGLKVKNPKTEAIWIADQQNTETPLGLKWCNNIKTLEILYFLRIKIDDKPIYYLKYVKAGILSGNNLRFDMDN